MKDAQGCDNRRVGATILWSVGVRMEKSSWDYTQEAHCKNGSHFVHNSFLEFSIFKIQFTNNFQNI